MNQQRTWFGLTILTIVLGNLFGLYLKELPGVALDSPTLVGYLSPLVGPIAIIFAFILYLVLNQHFGTKEKLGDLFCLLRLIQIEDNERNEVLEKIDKAWLYFENLSALFENSLRMKEISLLFDQLIPIIESEKRLELLDRWGRLKTIATTRLHPSVWIVTLIAVGFSCLFIAMLQFSIITSAATILGWDFLIGGFVFLIIDFDDPFTGRFNVKNPFFD